jgi:hypothetical protein
MRWNSHRSHAESSSVAAPCPWTKLVVALTLSRINGMTATSAQSAAIARPAGLPLVRRGHARGLVRAPGQRRPLSPDEAAHALKAERGEQRKHLDWRRDVAGMPAHVRDEIGMRRSAWS